MDVVGFSWAASTSEGAYLWKALTVAASIAKVVLPPAPPAQGPTNPP